MCDCIRDRAALALGHGPWSQGSGQGKRVRGNAHDIPLYYFGEDATAGDTTDQDVGSVCYIVTPGMQFGDEPHEAEEGRELGEESESATPAAS